MTWDLGPKDVLRKSQNWSGFPKNKGDNPLKWYLIKKLSTANRIFTHLSDIGIVSVKTNCWIFLIESNFKKIRSYEDIWPASLLKIKTKILGVDPELWQHAISRPKIANLPKRRVLSNHKYRIYVPFSPLHWAKFLKKSLEQIQSYKNMSFWAPEWPNCPELRLFQDH